MGEEWKRPKMEETQPLRKTQAATGNENPRGVKMEVQVEWVIEETQYIDLERCAYDRIVRDAEGGETKECKEYLIAIALDWFAQKRERRICELKSIKILKGHDYVEETF